MLLPFAFSIHYIFLLTYSHYLIALSYSCQFSWYSDPPFWHFLSDKKCGNSDYIDRIDLMECFLEVFDKNRIEALTADREFIGKEWLSWLRTNQIRYVFRVRENGQYISNARGKMVKIQELFRPLAIGSHVSLSQRRIGTKGEIFNFFWVYSPWLATIIVIKAERSKGKFAVNTPQACLGDRQI